MHGVLMALPIGALLWVGTYVALGGTVLEIAFGLVMLAVATGLGFSALGALERSDLHR